MKLAFYARLPQLLEAKVGLRPEDVFVSVSSRIRAKTGRLATERRTCSPRRARRPPRCSPRRRPPRASVAARAARSVRSPAGARSACSRPRRACRVAA